MSAVVERYAMTHGLNFVLVNLTAQWPIRGERMSIHARTGVGAIVPHTETTVLGVSVDRYELVGAGVQVAAGASYRLTGPLFLLGEYRFALARPEISVGDGTARMTAATHQIAAGLAWAFGG
jgi:opacity protein-like surface antigen